MTVTLLTEHHLVFLSLKGGCTGLSESTLVKMPHCWKSHVTAQLFVLILIFVTIAGNIFFIYEPGHVIPTMWHFDLLI